MAAEASRPRLLLLLPSTTYRAAAFVEAARRLAIDLTIGSDHRSTMRGAQPAAFLDLDFADDGAVAAAVAAFHGAHPLAGVLGVDDATAVAAAVAAGAAGLPHNDVAACRAAGDKLLQRRALAAAGIRIPRFVAARFDGDVGRLAAEAPWPCVVKPTRLSMSRGVMRADSPSQLRAAVERLRAMVSEPETARACGAGAGEFLVEEFVSGPEVALEGVLTPAGLQVLALFDKPDPLDGPFFAETIYATPSRLDAAAARDVAECVARSAAAIGLTRGPVHAEVRVNAAGPWLIELAARPIGGRCSAVLRFGAGEASLEEVLIAGELADWRVAMPARELDAVAVMMMPVAEAGTLAAVHGAGEARRVPWIDDVVITAHPGQRLRPLPEGSHYLGFIYARAADPGTATEAVRAAYAKLRVELA